MLPHGSARSSRWTGTDELCARQAASRCHGDLPVWERSVPAGAIEGGLIERRCRIYTRWSTQLAEVTIAQLLRLRSGPSAPLSEDTVGS